ncbi:carboxypeptidase regulatory-like domain-containing protein [Candidatus Kaiserbacteria bacterium]|nr:carboxypeptidase regulatory-like domain-containing protein [Candidatus Kaiserbacteria bacterium]
MHHTRALTWFLVILIGAIGLGYGGYDLYSRYVAFSQTIAHDRARAAEIDTNRARTDQAFQAIGMSPLQANQGFWYISKDAYGNESVSYFDADAWALRENLTDEQIAELTNAVARATVMGRNTMRSVPNDKLPPELQFHNQLYSNRGAGKFEDAQSVLESAYAKGTATADQLWRLSYMYELEGNYAKRDELNAVSCKEFKVRCSGTIPIQIVGTVLDIAGRPVQGAHVSVLSRAENDGATTNEKGEYAINVSVLPMEKLRLSAVKRNFSNGVTSIIVLNAGKKVYVAERIVLGTPIEVVTLDTVKHTVTDPADTANDDGSFILHATSSTYEIPADAIVDGDGKSYKGPVDVYIYEFTRDTVPQSLTTLDTFDQVMGYAGDLMQSYGMPYIQFFAQDGTELDVAKSRPMLLTYKIAAMAELRTNVDGNPAGNLTDAEMQLLIAVSHGDPGFPITRDFLVEQKLYTFPPFWVFDRRAGVWDNIGIRVLDTSGTIQTPFYTIK